jgi:hypothetical protein
VEQNLARRAGQQLEALEQCGEAALILHDGSDLEKPESVRVEGLCPVRSAKGRRLSRPRPKIHCVSPTAGAPILVPGIHWHAAVLIGRDIPTLSGKNALLDESGAACEPGAAGGRTEASPMCSGVATPRDPRRRIGVGLAVRGSRC